MKRNKVIYPENHEKWVADFMFEFLFSLRSTLMVMVPRGGIQIANAKSIGLTKSKEKQIKTNFKCKILRMNYLL